jgi:NADH-quinone oxidoreductase subunit M
MIAAYLMITGIFLIDNAVGGITFSNLINNYGSISYSLKFKILMLFVLAGLIKGGVYPLHIWMRTSYSESPDSFTSILSGILMKFGFYLIYLIGLFFPVAFILKNNPSKLISELPSSTFFAYLAGISIIIGTIAAILQNDAKKLIAFSSVSHAGYILLAFTYGTSMAFAGGVTHILVHALTALGMFLSIGAVYFRTGTTKIDELGGLIKNMPLTFTTYLVSIISLAGIPPLFGFVSKWMIYQSLIINGSYFLAFAAFFGSIGSFMYVFRPLAGVFLGQRPKKFENVKEVPFFMKAGMLIVTILTVLFGVLPGLVLKPIISMQQSIGVEPIKASLYRLFSGLTTLDMLVVFTVFGAGFILALIIFLLFAKPTRVKQHEQYTAGEIVPELQTQPSIYHYAKNYYKPFSRIFDKFPSMEKLYKKGAEYLSSSFGVIEEFFYEESINGYIWLISITFLVIIAIRWF